jgi:2Fe-2S ferredoxin
MPSIRFVEHDGTEHVVDSVAGRSVMRAAVDNGVPGIDADCGGECACATCHVFVDPAWIERTGPRNPTEQSMLAGSDQTEPNSRLSCQIRVTDALEGLIVHLPANQH